MTDSAMEIHTARVSSDWIDYNGHMNVGYYNVAFDKAADALFDRIGMGADYIKEQNNSIFTMETHVCYLGEVMENDPLRYTCQILDVDQKRVHIYMEMFHAEKGFLSATSEQMYMHIDMDARRSSAMPEECYQRWAELRDAHAHLPKPEHAGRIMGIKRK